jgi:hypothetical protein
VLHWPMMEANTSISPIIEGVELVSVSTKAGGEAFQMLRDGSVHLATGGRELAISDLPSGCPILCNIAFGQIRGLFKRPINNIHDLHGLNLAYPRYSLIRNRLENIAKRHQIRLGLLLDMDLSSTKDVVASIHQDRIDGVIGWEPDIGKIEKEAQVFPLPPNLLGDIEVVLAINLALIEVPPIRKFLRALLEATQFIKSNKDNDSFWKMVCDKLGARKDDFSGISFDISVETMTLLTLWEREVTSLRLHRK